MTMTILEETEYDRVVRKRIDNFNYDDNDNIS